MAYGDRTCILVHHTHPESPLYPSAEDKTEKMDHDGCLYYDEFVEAVPDSYDVVFTKTDHWVPRTELYGRLKDKIKEKGGYTEQFDRHLYGELSGSRFAVINGVEASVEEKDQHFTLNGLKIGEEKKYKNLSLEELYEESREAQLVCPAHPLTPGVSTPDRILEEFLEHSEEEDYEVGIEVAKGYSSAFNLLSLGLHRKIVGKRSLFDYSEDYDVPLIPETDWHAYIPRDLKGTAELAPDTIEALSQGVIPVEKLLDSDFDPMDFRGLSVSDHLESYPRIGGHLDSILDVPERPEDYDRILRKCFKEIEEYFSS